MDTHTLPAFIRHAQIDTAGTLACYRLPDGSTDLPELILAAVRLRREVQDLEARVNTGDVCSAVRERCAILQGRDIVHRRLLSEHVPGWDAALSWARTGWPRAQRAKNMVRAAERLGLWEGKL